MSSVTTVRRDEKHPIINEILEEDGCIVIENMLDEAHHEALEGEIQPLLDARRPARAISMALHQAPERPDRQIEDLPADERRARIRVDHG